MKLVLNIGNSTVSGAFFERDQIQETFHIQSKLLKEQDLMYFIKEKKIKGVLIGSDRYDTSHIAFNFFKKNNIPIYEISLEKLSICFDVEVPLEVGKDRIANTYGAIYSHPGKNVIVVDMGTALVFDVIAKEKKFLGGAIASGMYLNAKALFENTNTLPLVELQKPSSCLSRTTIGNIQSGIYYGLIGTIEKIVSEIKKTRFGQGEVLVIGTGGLLNINNPHEETFICAKLRNDLEKDLKEVFDYIEPDLTFFGLHEIYKELTK